MTDFKNLFEQAQMAEAAYANFLAIPDPKDALIAYQKGSASIYFSRINALLH